ncbi:MAG: CoA transferase [Chloroflexi bacterium]|nr:CoA transferase [Chloroflexota bacterium]
MAGALAPYRIIDLTREMGAVCTRMLAGLGADVVRVEPPGGDATRGRAPLVGRGEGLSAWWAQMHAGKRSITLNEGSQADAAFLLDLCASADAVVVSPDDLGGAWPLDLDALAGRAPHVVRTVITPFGLKGPKAGWVGSDLVGLASGGLMSLCGDPDRAPLRVAVEQAYALVGAQACVGTLLALRARTLTGRGQLVDVSTQAAVANALGNARLYYAMGGLVAKRAGGGRAFGTQGTRLIYESADGYVAYWRQPDSIRALARWFDEAGEPRTFDAEAWAGRALVGGDMPAPEEVEALESEIRRFFAARSTHELGEDGQPRGLMIYPVNTMADLVESEQLAARDFFVEADSPAGTLRMAGAPMKLSATPWRTGAVAAAGAHTQEVREVVAARPRVPEVLKREGKVGARDLFKGIRVADFSWVGVGPNSTQVLAWHGAEVIRVESTLKLDTFRSGGPRPGNDANPDGSAYWANHNRDKLGVQINLRTPGGLEAAKRLIAASDVVTESFTPGFMKRVGLDYESVRAINPDVIMMSMSMEGQDGPHAQFRGFGLILQAAAGITGFTSWPDRPPTGTGVAYTDWVAMHFAASSLLAALDHRERTGEGQYIDLSQLEAMTYALDGALVAALNGGAETVANGNRHPEVAPHGVFACAGNDRWCAISVMSDEQWAALCEAVGQDDWAADEGLRSAAGRKRREDELEAGLSAWFGERTAEEAQGRLQAAGVPAHLVATMADIEEDPQLTARGHFWKTDHPVIGPLRYDGAAYLLSETRAGPNKPAPLLGQHTEQVFREVLGYGEEELAELVASGALE